MTASPDLVIAIIKKAAKARGMLSLRREA